MITARKMAGQETGTPAIRTGRHQNERPNPIAPFHQWAWQRTFATEQSYRRGGTQAASSRKRLLVADWRYDLTPGTNGATQRAHHPTGRMNRRSRMGRTTPESEVRKEGNAPGFSPGFSNKKGPIRIGELGTFPCLDYSQRWN